MNFASAIRSLRKSLSWPPRRSDGDSRHTLGRAGERAAVKHLRGRRYRIIACNYDCPAGEIDLIATLGPTIIFVEVKSRSDVLGKDADHTVLTAQRDRLFRAAQSFLRQARAENRPSRFDVITVFFPSKGAPVVEHFENAFVAL